MPSSYCSQPLQHVKVGGATTPTVALRCSELTHTRSITPVATTKMNSTSSRGHAVFMISVLRPKADMPPTSTATSSSNTTTTRPRRRIGEGIGYGSDKIATMCIVDMAGVERARKSEAAGSRLRETCAINQSLRRVVRVFQQLKAAANDPPGKARVVPYRESKLTALLKPALAGTTTQGSRVVMLMTAYPGKKDYDEKRFALKTADEARGVVIAYKDVKSRVSMGSRKRPAKVQRTQRHPAWQHTSLTMLPLRLYPELR